MLALDGAKGAQEIGRLSNGCHKLCGRATGSMISKNLIRDLGIYWISDFIAPAINDTSKLGQSLPVLEEKPILHGC